MAIRTPPRRDVETPEPRVDAERTDELPKTTAPRAEEAAAPEPIDLRTIIAAALATVAAGMVTGGIFGVWSARLLGLFAALFGAFWGWLTLRSRERTDIMLGLAPVTAVVIGTILMIPAGGSPSDLPTLVSDAISSGRLLRPPVPFDAGWRPIMMLVVGMLGFASVWVGTALERPRLAIAVPLPLLALTAITQPDDGEFIAGLCAFIPLLASLAVLFSGDHLRASELTRAFEVKRAARSAAAGVVAVAGLVVLGNASFLFPEPVYDPSDQPQKPRPIPQPEDRVLFEIESETGITGPWKTGVLDVYDGLAWRLPPFDKSRFVRVAPDGVVNTALLPDATEVVRFNVRDVGNTPALPGTSTPARIDRPPDLVLDFDPRSEVFRVPEGRVPNDIEYSIALPPYPDAVALENAPAPRGDFTGTLQIGSPPGSVQRLLDAAPAEPAWARLTYVRERLQDVAVAKGTGVPVDIAPSRLDEILEGNHEASPFEIVAAETMLARWAGVPGRIGFGFDGVNDEDGVLTVRPRNAAQWLEAYFEGHGWIPLISAPEQAKTELNPEDARIDPAILPSDDVAVELYVPIKVESLKLLYERIREQLLLAAPYAAAALVMYLSWPAVQKGWRRRKRRRWAEAIGPRAQILVEYAEFRDLAHDLNVGDPFDTSLEYLRKVVDDQQHAELAWLVARSLYGDLADTVTDADAHAAEQLSASLRQRMFRGQPFQSRALAILSKASLRLPYSREIPTVAQLQLRRRMSERLEAVRRPLARLVRSLPRPRVPVLGRR